jgi:WD40 repeat protein/uncharacterized caspase-like protein
MSAHFSEDGRTLTTTSNDQIVRQWNVETGLLMRTLGPAPGTLGRGGLSRSGRYLVADGQGSLVFFDLQEESIASVARRGSSIAFSKALPTGERALLVDLTGSFEEWDLASATRLRIWSAGRLHIEGFALSENGSLGVAVADEGKMIVTDVRLGTIVRTFPVGSKPRGVFLSADGRHADTVVDGFRLRRYDVESGTLVGESRIALQGLLSVARFSKDGSRVLVGNPVEGAIANTSDGAIVCRAEHLWRPNSGSLEANSIWDAEFDPSGQRIALILRFGLALWDTSGSRVDHPGRTTGVGHFSLSPDGRYAIGTDSAGGLSMWDLAVGALDPRFRSRMASDPVTFCHLRPCVLVATKVSNHDELGIDVWDIPTGRVVQTVRTGDKYYIRSLAISPDDRTLLVSQRTTKEFDLATGNLVRSLPGEGSDTVDYSPDGSQIVVAAGEQLRVTPSRGSERGWSVSDRTNSSTWAVMGKSGLVAATNHDRVALHDRHSGAIVRKLGDSKSAGPSVFTPDGKGLFVAGYDGLVRLFDVATGNATATLAGCSTQARSLAAFPDGHRVMAVCGGILRMWDARSGAALSLASSDGEWLLYSDDGYFDSSRRGSELVAAADDQRAYRIDQLALRNNRPDLAMAKVGLGSPDLLDHFRLRHEARLRKAGLTEGALTASFAGAPIVAIEDVSLHGKSANVTFTVRSASPLHAYNVHVNGVPVFGKEGRQVKGSEGRQTESIELSYGSNRIEVSALAQTGIESLRALRSVELAPPSRGEQAKALYFLGIGVSRYQDPNLNLEFAHKDALDLASAFGKMNQGPFRRAEVKTLTDDQVTIESIRAARDFLSKATVDDTVVLFVGGHGAYAPDAASDYYFFAHGTDIARLSETAVPYDEFEKLLDASPARSKLMLMDACESGDRDPNDAQATYAIAGARGLISRGLVRKAGSVLGRPRPGVAVRDRFIESDLQRRTGAIVLSSSRGNEASYERADLQHGIFTSEVLRALTTLQADADHDRRLSTDELRDHVRDSVARATGDLQHPTVDRDNVSATFSFPITGP